MTITLNHYLALSAGLFSIGLFGALTRKSVVMIVMCIELMFNSVNINLVAFTYFLKTPHLSGEVLAVFIMVVSACEMGMGMGIALLLFRNRGTVEVDKINIMKW
jgi:NADH:ubiquinone oxidoreductase subunit K